MRQRGPQARLRDRQAGLRAQGDQAGETALFLGGVIGEDVGEIMVEERIAEALDHAFAIGARLFAHPDRVEDGQHLAVVEIVEAGKDRGVGEQGAHRLGPRAAQPSAR